MHQTLSLRCPPASEPRKLGLILAATAVKTVAMPVVLVLVKQSKSLTALALAAVKRAAAASPVVIESA